MEAFIDALKASVVQLEEAEARIRREGHEAGETSAERLWRHGMDTNEEIEERQRLARFFDANASH